MPRRRLPPALLGACPFANPVKDYILNLLIGTTIRRCEPRILDELRMVPLVMEWASALEAKRRSRKDVDVEDWPGAFERLVRKRAKDCPRTPREPESTVAGNLTEVGAAVDLDDVERQVLTFLVALHSSNDLQSLTNVFRAVTTNRALDLVAAATHLPRDRVRMALHRSGRLIESGLVSIEDATDLFLESKIPLKAGLLEAIVGPPLGKDGILQRFVPKAPPSTLALADYAHVQASVDTALNVLRAALLARRSGVNILLYGPTGTGKTELARLFSDALGVGLYVAGLEDEMGGSPSATERLSSLRLGQKLVTPGGGLILFDEAEDLFEWSALGRWFGSENSRSRISKQWFNHVLETNLVPTVWSTNRISGLDAAYLRRFTYAVELRTPGPRTRARVLARHLGESSELTSAEVEDVAQRFSVSPAQLHSAVTTAQLQAPDGRARRESVECILAPIEKVITGVDPSRRSSFDARRYRLDGVNASIDLDDLVTRLVGWEPGAGLGLSMCLYGPPGTGKSELVRYLAHRMGRPVLVKRGSDILGCFVGQTERNIAEAFEEAEADDSVLLFDEVDSFLRDRRGAQRSWEVTQVNEFLQQLEAYRGVAACTTNLWEEIDRAALRRFVFKIEMKWLSAEQSERMFAAMFGTPVNGAEGRGVRDKLAQAKNLAPGDFAAVARQARVLGDELGALELARRVVEEARMKGAGVRAVGFRSG